MIENVVPGCTPPPYKAAYPVLFIDPKALD